MAGPGAWLITRTPATAHPELRALSLDDPALAPFAHGLGPWLADQGAGAVLVRPDGYVFGAGEADDLAAAWQAALDRDAGKPQVPSRPH